MASCHEVKKTSRGGDDDIGPLAEGIDLRTFAHTSDDCCDAEGQVPGVCNDILLDLNDEFPRWRENQSPGAAAFRSVVREAVEHRQRECRRLSSAGLRDADNIRPREEMGNGCRLDRGWLCIANLPHRTQDERMQAKCFEGGYRGGG